MNSCFASYFIEGTRAFLDPRIEAGKVAKLIQELGREHLEVILENCIKDIRTPQGLIHNNLHVFNILVEKKPDCECLEEFAEMGKYILIDWEMAISGPMGRDIGEFFGFPVACILAHGLNGHMVAVKSILKIFNQFWMEYADALSERSQLHEECLVGIYRSAIGWAGFYLSNIFIPYPLPYCSRALRIPST